MNPATLQIILILLQDAPELIQAVIADFNLFAGGTLTEAQMVAQIQAMNKAWQVATAKWDAAGAATSTAIPVTVAQPIDAGAIDLTRPELAQ